MTYRIIIFIAFCTVFLASAFLLQHKEETITSEELGKLVSVVKHNFNRLAKEANANQNKATPSDKAQIDSNNSAESIIAIIYKKSQETWFIKSKGNTQLINQNLTEFTQLFLEQLKFDENEQPDLSHIPSHYAIKSTKPMRVATFKLNELEVAVSKLPGDQNVKSNILRWRQQLQLAANAPEFVKYQNNNKTVLVKLDQSMPSALNTANSSSLKTTPPPKEKLADFLQFELPTNWKQLNEKAQMASGNFQFTDNNKNFGVAVLRLPVTAPLEVIMNIWKNKAGIAADKPLKSSELLSSHQQQWSLIPLSGNQLNILVAMHKGSTKHTFIRLASDEPLTNSAKSTFKGFLKKAKVIKP